MTQFEIAALGHPLLILYGGADVAIINVSAWISRLLEKVLECRFVEGCVCFVQVVLCLLTDCIYCRA